MATILITGGTGMVGRQLSKMLSEANHRVIIITRKIPQAVAQNVFPYSYSLWNPEKCWIEASAIHQADYIIHLAGAGVADERWTKKRKEEILQSRVQGCKTLVQALTQIPNQVKGVFSASAIGWYGADTEESRRNGFTENYPADPAFLGDTCRQWEESILPVGDMQKRLAIFRIGIVLDKSGGALPEFLQSLYFRVAAILGGGQQVISWIHLHDLCRMFLFAIDNDSVSGVYNAVAPQQISNRELNNQLGKYLYGNKFLSMPVPAWVLQIMLGEMSIEVLKSATVSAQKIQEAGFQFLYPSIQQAIAQILPDKKL
ncbi:MAG: TIGR01777 family oxidoreductase [Chitinophagia bacterium]